jgi:dynein light chain Tctex-type 1
MTEIEEMEEDNSFPQDEIERVTVEAAEEILKEVMWDETLVPQWISTICEKITKALVNLNRPYKFVVTCVMQQKIGATIHSSMSCYWESTTDGAVTYLYPPPQRAKEAAKMSI